MSSYAELDSVRRRTRPLYLDLRVLNLGVAIFEELDAPTGYRLELVGARSLSPTYVNRLQRRIDDATPGLMKVLWAWWDEDLEGVLSEGCIT